MHFKKLARVMALSCTLLAASLTFAGCQNAAEETTAAETTVSEMTAESTEAETETEAETTAEESAEETEAAAAEAGAFDGQLDFAGSSTLAPVVSQIGESFIAEFGTWDKVDASFPADEIKINVVSGGSGQGVKAVLDKTSEFGMLARGVKDEEKEQIADMQEFQIGIDALTLAVNPNNPITEVKDNLTKDEIVKIFSGEYANWSDLDPSLPEKEIVVITRDISGGAHEVFQEKIMGDAQVKPEAIQAASMGALVQKIIDNEYAIGYASFGVVNQNEGKVTPLKVDGVEATEENIISGDYIIQRPLILIASGELSAENQAFMEYVQGETGASIITELGFIVTAAE